jgi:TRAP-type uncharacterized transport system substrate-binding protein
MNYKQNTDNTEIKAENYNKSQINNDTTPTSNENIILLKNCTDTQLLIEIVKTLWNIIDEIDTYSDLAKDNDKLYRNLVEAEQNKRWETKIETDGYDLFIKEDNNNGKN